MAHCGSEQGWLRVGMMVVVVFRMTRGAGAQQTQAEAFLAGCYTTGSANFVQTQDDAPLGSYDYTLAQFGGGALDSSNITTGIQCSVFCRARGRQLSGLARLGQRFACYCGVAWLGPVFGSANLTGSECALCAGGATDGMCPVADQSMVVYMHRPDYAPVTVVYDNCYQFNSSTRDATTAQNLGLLSSSFSGALVVTQQATTCITECALHGFRLGGVSRRLDCWCLRDAPPGGQTLPARAGKQQACILSVLPAQQYADVPDGYLCGSQDELVLYGMVAHRAPDVVTTPPNNTVLNRTVGDSSDSFYCSASIDSIYLPLMIQWTLGGDAGVSLTAAQMHTLAGASNLSTATDGGYSGGIFDITCVVRMPSDYSRRFALTLSAITVNVFSMPTGAVLETGIPIVAVDLPGSTYTVQCTNGGNGTAFGFRWSFADGTPASSTDTLTFSTPSSADEGSYTCSFSIQETGRDGTYVHEVTIYETPVLSAPLQREEIIGDTVRCSQFVTNIGDRGNVLSYEWTTPNGNVTSEDGVVVNNTGNYTCTVMNTVLERFSAGQAAQAQVDISITVLPLSSRQTGDGTDTTPIIIGVVCGVVGAVLIAVLVVVILKKRKSK